MKFTAERRELDDALCPTNCRSIQHVFFPHGSCQQISLMFYGNIRLSGRQTTLHQETKMNFSRHSLVAWKQSSCAGLGMFRILLDVFLDSGRERDGG
jgi:hypothetical protein